MLNDPTFRRPVVARDEWLAARRTLLAREKAATRLRDEVNAERLALPWMKVDKAYAFDTPGGRKTLADLFGPRSQLMVYHFMLGPGWEAGCPGCSFLADHLDGTLPHLEHHDVTLVAVSRAPLAEIETYRTRMGWRFPWVSSHASDFNYDFNVSFTEADAAAGTMYYNYEQREFLSDEMSGVSVFYKDAAGDIFHTYSSFARGNEGFLGTYHYLDIVPKGRDETGNGNLGDWVRHHDKYGQGGFVAPTGRYVATDATDSCCTERAAD